MQFSSSFDPSLLPTERFSDPPDPPDPPDPLDSPATCAWEAAEAVRELNHATLSMTGARTGYRHPCDVDAVLAGVQALVERLPQTLSQASAWLTRQDHLGKIGHDAHPPQHRPVADRAADDVQHAPGGVIAGGDGRGVVAATGENSDPVGSAVASAGAALEDAVQAVGVLGAALTRARSINSHLTGVD